MIAAIVVLHLITWDCDTGKMLEESTHYFQKREVWSDTIEDCRRFGVREAKELSARYRSDGYNNASSNVDCEWMRDGAPS